MAITLNAIHATAQTAQTRRPLCKILSVENVAAIPFNGELLSTATPSEQYPAAKVHSTGRLFVAFAVDGATDIIRFGYTDTARTFFTYVDLTLAVSRICGEITFCEMADAYIGLIWEENYGGTRTIKYRKLTVTGVDPTPAVTGTILTNNTADWFTGPTVIKMADDSYLMVYGVMAATHYHLYRRTSADFVTWAAAAEVDTSGLTDTSRKANPALIELASGSLWLLFDYLDSLGPNGEELTNVYYVSSADKLATASGETALTSYTGFEEKAEHPAVTQKATADVYMAFTRLMASLHMDENTTGWLGSPARVVNMHIDVATQKLYVVTSTDSSLGGLQAVVKIDLATWTVDKAWNTGTVPPFPAYFASHLAMEYESYRGDGHYIPVGCQAGFVSVLDALADTITTYSFVDLAADGIAKNVTWTSAATGLGGPGMAIAKVWVDVANDRLYVVLYKTYIWNTALQIGWIDLTAAGPTYTFTTIVAEEDIHGEQSLRGFTYGEGCIEFVPAADIIICSFTGGPPFSAALEGYLRVYSLSTGGLWKDYRTLTNPTFPKWGLPRIVYNAGKVVGGVLYQAAYGQSDYRGLCTIDLASDIITYDRPSWATVDDYKLGTITLTDDLEYLIAAGSFGVTLFDGTTWTLYSNATVPGLTPNGLNQFTNPIVYNPTTDMIIAGHPSGIVMFSRDGYIKQSNYRIGTVGGTVWGAAAPLVQGFTDYDAAITIDPDDDGIYAFWTNKYGSELSIKWDKEMPSFDLTDYLVRGTSVERSSTLDPHEGSWDAGLSFTVTHGYLFDASNGASLLRQYLTKGRKIQQQFGDTVSGVDYWETARIFTISDDGEMTYKKGEYPTMSVEAETLRRRWEQIHIIASEYYQTTPELLIADLLTTYAGITAGNISLGTWANSATVDYQFVDVSLAAAVNQVAVHFGYVIRDGANGIIQAVKITDAGAVTQTYSNNTKLLNATPRNKYSDFTNRWIVQCEEQSFIELLMAEELAAELNASHRWNTGSKTYRVNYTQGSKIYRNPRMEVVTSVEALAFSLAGGCSEVLVDNSHLEADQTLWDTYCEIDVDSPDLTAAFIAALAGIVGSYFIGDVETETETIPVGSYIRTFFIFTALNILAATGNFYYKVYGQPVVKVRRTVSAQSDDTAMQVKMGQIITEQPFDDPICGSPSDCQAVADFRKLVGMGERARWAAEMVADLRNEEGDTLSVTHPHSGNAVTVFLTDLTTSYLMPESENGDGGITQSFEGWRR